MIVDGARLCSDCRATIERPVEIRHHGPGFRPYSVTIDACRECAERRQTRADELATTANSLR